MDDKTRIIQRVRHLLAFTKDASRTPDECAMALARAQKLMHEYGLSATETAEGPRVSDVHDPVDEWELTCYRAAGSIYGALIVRDSKHRFVIVGRDHIVEATRQTAEYLIAQVHHWYKTTRARGLTKSARAAFRRDFRDAMAKVMFVRALEMSSTDTHETTGVNALVVRSDAERKSAEAMEYYKSKSTSLTTRPANLDIRMTQGTAAGLIAGDQVALKQQLG